jgi:ferredoxin, 2Fe-2S
MARIRYIQPDGVERVVEVETGETLMQAAVNSRVDGIVAECGGACMCATCHVYVDDDYLDRAGELSDSEDEMLEATAAERKSNSRLSCQIKAKPELDGVVIRVAPEQI